ncbi:MAG: tRNA (adenosine(37)-N6)-threonylcarbamoyltransferase complex ATPase subunit type 1 TsaE [Acidobacteriota bacterium]
MTLYRSTSEEETLLIGKEIGRRLVPPRVVLLYGELGAGKTVLTRGLVEGLDVQNPAVVHSPTFTLVNQYAEAKGVIYHLDLYRLETTRDLYSIGIEDILASPSIVIVEWAEKLFLNVEDPVKIRIAADWESGIRNIEVSG